MVLLTMIARVSDGLPLATSIEGDEERDHNMVKYSNQAKDAAVRRWRGVAV